MLEEFEFESDEEASIPTPVSLSPFIDSTQASPRASPLLAPFNESDDEVEESDSEVEESVEEKIDSAFYDTVSQRLADYVSVISDRLSREGNYEHLFDDDEDEIPLFEEVYIKQYNICFHTMIRKKNGDTEYVLIMTIYFEEDKHYPFKEVVLWSHPEDETEPEFNPPAFFVFDTVDLFRPKIRRFNRYLPFRMCASKTCVMLLTEKETDHCFECYSKFSTCACSICMDEQTPKLVLTTSCNHSFHLECFLQIVQTKRNRVKCPLCR